MVVKLKHKEPEHHICSVCGTDYQGYGNNAWPINDGRCCDDCNSIVVHHRMKEAFRQRVTKAFTG